MGKFSLCFGFSALFCVFLITSVQAQVSVDNGSGFVVVGVGEASCSDCVKHTPIGPKCGEGACVKEHNPKSSPQPQSTAEQVAITKRKQAEADYGDAAREMMIEEGDLPLADTSAITDWLREKLSEKLLGPAGELMDAIAPDSFGESPFDKPKNPEQMKALRVKLDLEEKEQLEKNKKALEKNEKIFFPESPDNTQDKPLAHVEKAIRSLASLQGDDLNAVADHVLRRGQPDSRTPISQALTGEIVAALAPMTRANVCLVKGGSCILVGAAKGDSCFCPKMTSPTTFIKYSGKAGREQLGQYCRKGENSSNLGALFPLGVSCLIAVDVSLNPAVSIYEHIRGRVSKSECKSWDDKFSDACQ